jgi:nucleoside-diphosphate-sugar epimerase
MIDLANMVDNYAPRTHIPDRLGESRVTLADISKAKKLLKWKPKIKIEEWL